MTEPSAQSKAGTITKLSVQKHDTDRASVFLDGKFAFGVHQNLVLKYGLQEGRMLTLEEQKEITQEDRLMKARAAAFDYLAHKPRSEGEVRQRLREKDYEEEIVDRVVERLHELGYLDDAEYVREYVRGRFANKGYGPMRIRQELRQRGVDGSLIDAAFEEQFDEEELLEAAREHAHKKWERLDAGEDLRRRKQKLLGYLQRRGFSYDTIYQVIDEVTRDT